MSDADAKADRMLKLLAGSSWFNFVCETQTLIDQSTDDEVYDWAVEVCPSLKESVPKLRRMLDDMAQELSKEISQCIVDIAEGEE